MQHGEQEIFQVKRHPFGIIAMYTSCTVGLLLAALMLFVALPYLAPESRDVIIRFGALFFLVLLLLVLAFVAAASFIYWGNRWILTSDSLTQVSQFTLFNKQSSQLSLANLEDVTAQTNGILAKMFNFGILKAETAGEHSKFTFLYCPSPEKYAQQILLARERFEQHRQYDLDKQATAQATPPVAAGPAPQAPAPEQTQTP